MFKVIRVKGKFDAALGREEADDAAINKVFSEIGDSFKQIDFIGTTAMISIEVPSEFDLLDLPLAGEAEKPPKSTSTLDEMVKKPATRKKATKK